ncbi:MAG: MBL fold metallo-hydrolase [Phycisphaeraceae bacterium]|jgi:phosphoribosyl 1,2-cyclic phosphate phosphodiesterase|nr:MBL fold metallo-hydrolase [Phycisphaeraceae bacterium]
MSLELLFLGTGTSAGVPMIGCDCEVCHSTDPRDKRTRPSVLVRYRDPTAVGEPPGAGNGGNPHDDATCAFTRQLLIDCAPEMRLQVIKHGINRIDGLLLTHAHADHIFGIDDLRRFNAVMNQPINIYTEQGTYEILNSMFSYIFEAHKNVNQSFVASLIQHRVEAGAGFELFGAWWTPLRLLHGRLPILGFRVDRDGESLAYCTDVSSFPPETYPLLEGLDVLVIDALRHKHHPTHMTVDQALSAIENVQPRRAYLTHIAHDIKHADLEANLPEHVFLSFDGLTINCR